ncbi:hypothetical protein ACWIUD_01845 [Helicobacter sp. 23-1044]
MRFCEKILDLRESQKTQNLKTPHAVIARFCDFRARFCDSQNLGNLLFFLDGCFTSFAKQGEVEVSLSNPADCHENATHFLAMTEF